MSTTIDERVVEMQFDNRQFEKNITQSITSLDELKKSLDLNTVATKTSNFIKIFGGVTHAIKGGITGLGNIAKSVKNFTFSLTGLNSVLASNASKMTSTLAALTGGAITSGFEEYELKVNSVRTILSNVEKSGKGIGDVTEALEQLNAYADKTIYNFAEMTRNIGYFTVAGVGLEESVSSIKGFMNLAALQGVDATAAARATYQLSQAMSTGSMRLMDWRSMENAGMGGKNFQDMLVTVGKSMGVQYDNLLKKHNSFRETLSEGWLTSDVMMKTLQLYSGDFGEDFVKMMSKSGYVINAFNEAIDGNDEKLKKYGLTLEDLKDETGEYYKEEKRNAIIAEAIGKLSVEERELETIEYIAQAYKLSKDEAEEYYKMAVKANEAAKEVTTFRKLIDALSEAAQSGWSASWEIILGNVEEAKYIFTPISDEIGGILQASADARNKMLKEWKEGTVLEVVTDEDGNVIKKTYKFFEAIANIYAGLKSIAGKFKEILGTIFPSITSSTLIEKTNQFYELSQKFRAFAESEEGLAKFAPILNAISAALKGVVDIAKSIGKGAFALLKKLFSNENLSAGITKVANAFASLFSSIDGEGILSKVFGFLADVATPVISVLGDALSWLVDIIKAVFAAFKSAFSNSKIGDFFAKIPSFASKAVSGINNIANAAGKWFKSNASFERVYAWGKTTFDSFKDWYKQSTVLPKIGKFFGNLWASVTSIFHKSEKAKGSGKKLPDAFSDSVSAVLGLDGESQQEEKTVFQKIGGWLVKAYTSVSTFIKNAANTAWSIISGTATWIFETAKSIGATIGNVFTWIANTGLPGIFEGIKTVIGFLGDIIDYVLEIAPGILKIVSALSMSRSLVKASRGLEMFGHGFEMLGDAINTFADAKVQLAKAQKIKSIATVLLAIGAMLVLIVGSIYFLSTIPAENNKQIWNGIGAVAAILGALTVFVAVVGVLDKTMGAGKSLLRVGAGLLGMVGSIVIFAYAIRMIVSVLNGLTTEEALGALATIAGIFTGLIFATKILSSSPNLNNGNSWQSILAMSAGIILIVMAVNKMTKILNNNEDAVVWEAAAIVSALLIVSSLASRIGGNKMPSGLLGTAIALVAFVGVIHLLTQYNPRELTAPILTISAILLLLSVLGRSTGGSWKASLSLLAMVGVLVAITKSLMDLSKLDPLKLGVAAGSLSVILLSIAKFSTALGGLRITQALKAVVIFGIILLGITAVVATMGWLFDKIDGLSSSATKRNGSLNTFGAVIGEFIGEIVGGFAAGASSHLGDVAVNICEFGDKIAPFLDTFMPKLSSFNPDDFKKLGEFTTALSKLQSPETDKVTGGFGKLGKDIKGAFVTWSHKTAFDVYAESIGDILSSMQNFIDAMGGFTDDKKAALDAAVETLRSLFTSLNNVQLPEERFVAGGLLKGTGWLGAGAVWIERAKLDSFTSGIATLLPAITDYIEAVDSTKVSKSNLEASLEPFQSFITAVSEVSLPTESWTGNLTGFVAGALFNGFVQFKNTEFVSYAAGVGTLLASAQEFIKATDGIETDTDQLSANLEAFKNFIVEVSKVNLPKESTSAGFSINNFFSSIFGPEKIVDTYFEEYNTTFTDLTGGIASIIASITQFKADTEDLTGDKKAVFDAALASVVAFLDDISSIDPRILSTKMSNEDSKVKAYFDEEYEDIGVFSSGISTILSAVTSFSETALVLGATGRQQLEKALGTVVNFMEYVSTIDPQTLVKKELSETTTEGGQTIKTYFETKNNTFIEFGNGIDSALTGVSTLIGALEGVTNDQELLTNLGLALDAIKDFVSTISEHPLPLVSETSYTANDEGAITSYLQNVYNDYGDYGSGIGSVLTAAAALLNAFSNETVKAAVSDGTFADTLTAISDFIGATTANPLPVLSEETSSTQTNASGTVKSYLNTQHTTYSDYASGIGQLVDSAKSLLTALEGKEDIDIIRLGTVLGLISSFIGTTTATPLPSRFSLEGTSNKNGDTSASSFVGTLTASYNDYAGGISAMWQAAIDLIAAMNGKSDSDIANLESTLTLLSTFLTDISTIELPQEDYTKIVDFTNILTTHNSKFGDFAGGVSTLLTTTGQFINDVKDLTGTQQASVATAFGDLVSFINAFNNYKLPVSWSFSFSEGLTDFYELSDLSVALGPMGEGLAAFYSALGSTEGVIDIIKELNGDMDSSTLAGSAKVASFFAGIFDLFNNVVSGMYMIQTLEGHTLTFGGDALTGFLQSVSNMVAEFVNLINEEGILDDLDSSGIFQLGVAFVKTISSAMANGGYTDEIGSAFEPIVLQITDVLSAFGSEFESSGKVLAENFKTGLVNGFKTIGLDLKSGSSSELSAQFTELQGLLQGALDSDLTIRPVFDMTGIESDITKLNDLTGNAQVLNFNGTKKRVEMTADLSTAIDGQISRVVTAVDALGPKIDAVGQSMKSIRVWIDGSVLAGYLLPTIDSGLATSANRSARGAASSKPSLNPNYSSTPSKVY